MDPFEKSKDDLIACDRCKDVFGYQPKPIFQGHKDSLIMQIGQAPSKKVMETGKPFYDMTRQQLLTD